MERYDFIFSNLYREGDMQERPDGEWIRYEDAAKLLTDRDAELERLRAMLDSEASHRLSLCADNERFVAEIERLREDLVWAIEQRITSNIGWDGRAFIYHPAVGMKVGEHDGTPESICRAVREARDGVR